MSDMKSWAVYYAERGLPIIPLNGKIPRVAWSAYQDTAPSIEQVKQWWTENPDSNVGMVCGKRADRLILDIDGEEGQKSCVGRFMPLTPTVKTRRGYQQHFTYPRQYEGKTTLAGLLLGVDIRGEAGIAVLPPSKFSDGSGRYCWINDLNTPLAECPEWLLKLLEEKNKPKAVELNGNTSWLKEKLDAIAPGNRNASFTAIAGSLRSRGYSSGDIFELLRDKATGLDFQLTELRTVCDSVSQYEPRRDISYQVNTEAQSVEAFLADEQKVEWIVPGILAKRSIGFIAGLQETSKTWLAMDLAIEVAKGGGHWLGKFPVNGAKVLFIDQERFKGETQRRFKALLEEKQIGAKALTTSLSIICGSTTRLNLQPSFEAFKRVLSELQPSLVVVDSFATFHTVTENDRMEIQKVIELIKQLRNEFGCTFLFINHEGKSVLHHEPGETKQPHSADMMGSIAVPAAAELVLTVRKKDEESSMVYMTKNSLATKIEPFEVCVIDTDDSKTKIKVEAK